MKKLIVKNKRKTTIPSEADELNVYSLFSGIGCYEYALKKVTKKRINLIQFAELDKQTAKMYCMIHNEMLFKNIGDVHKIVKAPTSEIDWMFGSFPCKEFSKASSVARGDTKLMDEALRIVDLVKPKNVLMENVPNFMHRYRESAQRLLDTLTGFGYTVSFFVLDAQYFGLPQSRTRLFIYGGKDRIKPHTPFTNSVLKDFMEPDFCGLFSQKGEELKELSISPTLVASYGKGMDKRGQRPVVLSTNGEYRKMFPVEAFRLQGFADADCRKLERKFSDSTLFRGIGNGIAIPVLEEIFRCALEPVAL